MSAGGGASSSGLDLRSLAYATDIDVLVEGAIVTDHGAFVSVASPDHPTFHWGNFLLYREPPAIGDRERWEADFRATIGAREHFAFGWDRTDGELGTAMEEFIAAAGYELELMSALVAAPDEILLHARASDATVRMLDPVVGGPDDAAWQQVIDVRVSNPNEGHTEAAMRRFVEDSVRTRRASFTGGRPGGWFVAEDAHGVVVASGGLVVTDGRARFQAIDTRAGMHGRGHASRLIHDIVQIARDQWPIDSLVIVADTDYHAKALYQSLGFVDRETVAGVAWWTGRVTATAPAASSE